MTIRELENARFTPESSLHAAKVRPESVRRVFDACGRADVNLVALTHRRRCGGNGRLEGRFLGGVFALDVPVMQHAPPVAPVPCRPAAPDRVRHARCPGSATPGFATAAVLARHPLGDVLASVAWWFSRALSTPVGPLSGLSCSCGEDPAGAGKFHPSRQKNETRPGRNAGSAISFDYRQ